MGQQVRTWQGKPWKSASSQRMWLSMLVAAMEEVSRPDQRSVPCDSDALAGLRAQLMRPASACVVYASPYSLRN